MKLMEKNNPYVVWFEKLGSQDVARVGGKNASLGEMIGSLKNEGIRVPDGFATTSDAYREFLAANDLEEKIGALLEDLKSNQKHLEKTGKAIRRLFMGAQFPAKIAQAIRDFYSKLAAGYDEEDLDVAVRSSATAESLASENASRLASMQGAERNIAGQLDDLNRQYHQKRQMAITEELLDIVSGFEALKGG
jgi:pyruvate, water dikinase